MTIINALLIIVQSQALMSLGHLVRANSLTLFSRRIPEGVMKGLCSYNDLIWPGWMHGWIHGWMDEWEM